MNQIVLICFVLIFSSCSSATSTTESTTTPTITAIPSRDIPTLIPTLIPLSEINLEPILILEGDLPAGYFGAQVGNPPRMFDDVPIPINSIYKQFAHENEASGGVTILLYNDQANADKAFDIIEQGFGEDIESVQGDWDKSSITISDFTLIGGIKFIDFVYIHCKAVVHIRMSDTTDENYVINYVQRLDERLAVLVCR